MTLSVIKIGGSVLTGLEAYRRVAAALVRYALELPESRLLAVASAEYGATDALLGMARATRGTTANDGVTPEPDRRALDLLLSTGEVRSVALLTLALHAEGCDAIGLNVHECGLVQSNGKAPYDAAAVVRPQHLRGALASHRVVVVPGFLGRGRGRGGRIVSLGRGGSDLTAVLVAAALGAERCEIVKNVPGYFTENPALNPQATCLPALSYEEALAREAAGCGVVQRAALEVARRAGLPLLIRSLDPKRGGTIVHAEAPHAACGEGT